ncbi:hypothetical protein ACFVTP_34445 [Streptomyces celluloflavus]|uniref:hypothetical protein n=1 Tax=Streptomyces celluloflavus TaxID=58344 RepID=UPI0036DB07A7
MTPVGERCAVARFRSLLPFGLTVVVGEVVRDPDEGTRAGWGSGRTVEPDDGRTRVRFAREAGVCETSPRPIAVPARPLFLVHYALMMRAGLRGPASRPVRGGGAANGAARWPR